MRSDKFKAYKLRLAGRSYNEITRLLKVPKSTLSGWFADLELTEKATKRLKDRVHVASLRGLIARNKNQTALAETRSREMYDRGEKLIKDISKRDLLIIGTALYWAEGYKRPVVIRGKTRTSHRVSLTNSDPDLICIFLKFLREVCKVPNEKITIWIRYFEHQDPTYLLNFWQKKCNIPYSNFRNTLQTVSISSQRKKSYNSLSFGVAQISVNNTNLYHEIMGMISGVAKNK
ncbi:MAG: hypothetical protein A3B86_04410 [Candidatus Yanofskybacteria bacterium RIFCSPHIGHO2_02_FULL_38_22b]|uniref:Uncharacterized protein n=1 Tax=Candidatus Yanofskybacteria bacterium RIFCSPHIGHO2_02_FULL_38_22b TaxID=1802673 RepID=A0A1F8EZM9_9BACT|nr:MAG: hypothetical protein A2816_02180 [Candidatus Yanofskybacteria bacterium RIFCSPHIGHO2_01_FULL_39_44]OGN06327.1 MAG: hypothetical protein A3B86_04410 [Candidatus Yanofskybacteria bacterium RIFCSPHIGHO2_02_FULL_38_22b]OGN19745.1 MAG: hypothetical protein A2910_04145 [Candidatus Yanofskybacteria bacterium RIFCSPLOWO2_01_FULL_39_28]